MTIEVGLIFLQAIAWVACAVVASWAFEGFHNKVAMILKWTAIIAAISWGVLSLAVQTIHPEPLELREWTIRIGLATKLLIPVGLSVAFYLLGKYRRGLV